MKIDWGDGGSDSVAPSCVPIGTGNVSVTADAAHTYAHAGTYRIQVTYVGANGGAAPEYAVIAPPVVSHVTTTTSTSGSGGATTHNTTATVATTSTSKSTSTTTSATTTGSTPLPPPVEFKTANVAPVSGIVYIELPTGASLSRFGGAAATASATKGTGFVPLTQARQIPVGSILDTRQGTVAVTAASTAKGQLSTGDFTAGVFVLLQSRAQRGLTELDLRDAVSRHAVCASVGKGARAGAAKKVSNAVLGLLKSTDHGRFSTRGNYSAATVRGTQYSVADTCAGTLTTVTRGSVVVNYFRRHRNIVVTAGHAFLAKASGGPSSVVTVGKRHAARDPTAPVG